MTDAPDLRIVLEHYGATVGYRVNQMISCVLHEDKTPSCSVNINKGLWSCKSCGKGGNSWTLIMEKEETDFVGARTLATTLGFAAGTTGGDDGGVSGSRYAGGRKLPPRKRDHRGNGGYVPAWRRP